jgi:membrane fusion protein, multidrug efflux system
MSAPITKDDLEVDKADIALGQANAMALGALNQRLSSLFSLRAVLMGVPILVVAFVGLWIYASGGRWMQTENAYIKASKAQISVEISGTITKLNIKENQHVNAGDVLFTLDKRRLKTALEAARAAYNVALGQVMAEKATYRQRLGERDLAKESLAFARRELQRRKALTKRKIVSEATLDEYVHARDVAISEVQVKQQEIAVLHARLGDPNAPASVHPVVLGEQARVELALEDLRHTEIHAPIAGTVGSVPVLGDYVLAGVPAMVIVADQGLWIEANFKETALTHMHIGQYAKLRMDAYPDAPLKGHVSSIDPATGSEFALLPAQNASGNWVKVVQRVPVRIALDGYQGKPVLRAGMSVKVRIDTGYHRPLPGFLRALLRWLGADVG